MAEKVADGDCTDCGIWLPRTECPCGAKVCATCRREYHGKFKIGCASFAGKKLRDQVFRTRRGGKGRY